MTDEAFRRWFELDTPPSSAERVLSEMLYRTVLADEELWFWLWYTGNRGTGLLHDQRPANHIARLPRPPAPSHVFREGDFR